MDSLGRLFRRRPSFPFTANGTFADIPAMVERLAKTPGHQGTLVIQVLNAEPFVQFTGGAAGVEMDLPMITAVQRERRELLRRFFQARGFHTRASFGSDGGEFLDVDLPADAARLAEITTTVLTDVFRVSTAAPLQFMGEGPGLPPN